ncbi:hypothetical protein HGK34_16585 [Myceligenerans sp. I2]|uniref:G5 domain-containing protein n=2 Tax=Myceligenerans indicum TaxID=2593663 RepID=A0ABS1LNS6_9MICO|nr:hypothetical protein [Myceligenerans indicum]
MICAAAFTAALSLSGCATSEPTAASSSSPASPSQTASPSPTVTQSPTPKPTPVTTTKKVTKKEAIPFEEITKKDPNLDKGTKKVTTQGVKGVRTKTYRVTYVDGKETERELVKKVVTKEPVDKVVSVGTRTPPPPEPAEPEQAEPEPNCDPNYSGACVPIASDVDCASGSGNGPAYVRGPVYVTGSDIYDLDRDGDGVACET